MRLLSIIAISAIVTVGLNAADPAGTWKGSMQTHMGDTGVAITLRPGAALAGTVVIAEYQGPIEKAKSDGDKINFEINIEPGRLTFEGTVAGDEMKLNVTGTQGDKYLLICKRQK
jgi:hypothetical protein